MLNQGLMGSKDLQSFATCVLHEEFLASMKPFGYHDVHKYGVGHFTVSDSILKIRKENAKKFDDLMHPCLVHYIFHMSVVHGGAHAEQLLMEIQELKSTQVMCQSFFIIHLW